MLALLAAAFTLATAIGGRVIAQRRQIGLLRAIGMTPVQVTGLLVAHYVVLAVLAAPLGLAGGALVAERLSASAADALGAPAHPPPSVALLALALVVALLVVAARHRAARLARRADAVQAALALGRGATSARASRVAAAGAAAAPAGRGRRRRQGRVRAARAHDPHRLEPRARGRPRGDAMGFEATMDRLGERPGAARAAVRAAGARRRCRPPTSTACSPAAARSTAVARVREIVMTGRGRTEIHARVLDGPLRAFPFAVRDGRAARVPGEVTLGRGALDALGARIGDRVALRAGGRPVTLRVVGRHIEPDDDGRGAVTSLRGLPAGAASSTTPTGACAFARARTRWRPPRR